MATRPTIIARSTKGAEPTFAAPNPPKAELEVSFLLGDEQAALNAAMAAFLDVEAQIVQLSSTRRDSST